MEFIVKYNATEQKIIDLIAQYYGIPVEDITYTSHLTDDLALDSLDLVELLLLLEEELDCGIEDQKADQWVTIKDIFDYIEANNLTIR